MFLLNENGILIEVGCDYLQYKMFLLNRQVAISIDFKISIYNTKCFY